MSQDAKPTGSNTVPIVAIVAGAVVGVVGPLAGASVARKTRRELDALAVRQRVALHAERERLQVALRAEGQRWRGDKECQLLDRGTVLIEEFRTVVTDMRLDARGKPIATDEWREMVHEVAVFRGRLLLWFDDSSPIVAAFDGVMQLTAWRTTWAAELRAGERWVKLIRAAQGSGAQSNTLSDERTLEHVDAAHERYMRAARAYLDSQRSVGAARDVAERAKADPLA